MTCGELVATLGEHPDYFEVFFGEYSIEVVEQVSGSIVLGYSECDSNGGVVGNPPGDLDEWTIKKLKERGLSIEGIEPKPCRREKFVELKRPILELIAQLGAWSCLKNARLRWEGRVHGYGDDEADVEHYISWHGLDDPNDIAGRLIDAYDNEKREREKLKELKAKYPEEAD